MEERLPSPLSRNGRLIVADRSRRIRPAGSFICAVVSSCFLQENVGGARIHLPGNNFSCGSVRCYAGRRLRILPGRRGAGFKVLPPKPVLEDPRAGEIQKVLEEKINPGVAMHGGFVELIDVKENRVFLKLGGGCQGCGMVDVTLKQGIETMIKEAVPTISEVLDVTDHASGTNPYYQPGK